MGTAAYAAFMASITNKKFTATQYALLTSLMGIPRVIASAPTGFFAKHIGWEPFFIGCALVAIPGLLLLVRFVPMATTGTVGKAFRGHSVKKGSE
jgi:PAT family beta-lactamase induction signal transducer AmpG